MADIPWNGWRLMLGVRSGALLGCASGASEDGTGAGSVVADTSSRVDTLVVLLPIRAASEASYLHASQLRRLELWVDGVRWGTYAASDLAEPEASADQGAWQFVEEPSQALFVAPLLEADGAREQLETAGDWVELLDRQLVPEGHVAELRQLTVSNGSDEGVMSPNLLVAFTILDGFRPALVGELEISIDTGDLP